jgi:DNA-binding LacI/PurR family transcriptional regulator
MSVRQEDIAERLNLSGMTVSRALRGDTGVGEATRRAVCELAERLGYRPLRRVSGSRRSARPGKYPRIICASLSFRRFFDDEHSFFGRIVKGLHAYAEKHGVEVADVNGSSRNLPELAASGRVDGWIFSTARDDMPDAELRRCPPAVCLIHETPLADVVTVDNFASCRTLGRHLTDLGHRTIAFVGNRTQIARERAAGLRAAMQDADGEMPDEFTVTAPRASDPEHVEQLMDRLLSVASDGKGELPFTALAAYNDYMAAAAVRHLEKRGIRVPEDVSVVGFDGTLPIGWRDVKPTTMSIPLEQMGAEAVGLLIGRSQSPDAWHRRLVLETRLEEGNTTAPPAR